jgi:trehalose 6-phosphate phosphatase
MATPLQEHRAEVEREIRSAARVWVGLDFDGTLVDIAGRPDDVAFAASTRSTLEGLAARPDVRLAIISGRELSDVRSRVGIDSLAYSGNHGLQIEGPQLTYESPIAQELEPLVARMAEAIKQQLSGVPGVLVEDKRLSLSVHYRLVMPQHWQAVRDAVAAVAEANSMFRMKPGAMVWEVRPAVAINKGTAAAWLHTEQSGPGALPIFLGDDVTDEDAFRALPEGITVLVGPHRATAARYRVHDHREVHDFLEWVSALRS